jgi:hypothetical protein
MLENVTRQLSHDGNEGVEQLRASTTPIVSCDKGNP